MSSLLNACGFYKTAVIAKIREIKASDAAAGFQTRFVLAVNGHNIGANKQGTDCTLLHLRTMQALKVNRSAGKACKFLLLFSFSISLSF